MQFQPAPASLPPGQRIYAVGDVHGCIDQLRDLYGQIEADLTARPTDRATLVHIGDIIDRGPNSAAVVDLLAKGPPIPDTTCVTLLGNHEDMMLKALASLWPEDATLWRANGGTEALESWGIDFDAPPESWADRIPPAHLAFLKSLPLTHRAGGYLFVHAGLRPGTPLERQAPHDMLWIRSQFFASDTDFGFVVVHGHTPLPAPVIRPNRIGIDTGAVKGGKLTCAVLEEDRVGFLTA